MLAKSTAGRWADLALWCDVGAVLEVRRISFCFLSGGRWIGPGMQGSGIFRKIRRAQWSRGEKPSRWAIRFFLGSHGTLANIVGFEGRSGIPGLCLLWRIIFFLIWRV